jgi:hypothetical protein
MVLILFALSVFAALRGFQVGGVDGFLYLIGAVMLMLFGLASLGMDSPPRVGRRPPSHPPGWKNVKRRK